MHRLLLLSLSLLSAVAAAATPPPHALAAADHASRHYEAAQVELLAELVRFRTVHEDGIANAGHPQFRAFAAHLRQRAEQLGLDFRDHGAVLVVGLGDGPERLGVVTHGDVQPADPAKWKRSPFELDADSEPGRLIARGSEDDKGPIATAMYAMKSLRDLGLPLKRRIELIVSLTEESDWEPFRQWLQQHPPPEINVVIDAAYPVVLAEKGWGGLWVGFSEPSATPSSAARVDAIEGGAFISQVPEDAVLRLHGADDDLHARLQARIAAAADGVEYRLQAERERLQLQATGRAAHSSAPEDGINALTHLAALFEGEPLAPTAAGQAVDFINSLLGTGLYGERFGDAAFRHPFMGPLTVNLSTARSSADGVELAINLRAPVGKPVEQLEAELRRAIADWAAARSLPMPALRIDLNPGYFPERAPQADSLLAVYRHFTGDDAAQPLSIGGGTHARLLPNAVNFGPSMPGQPYTGHSEHEFITREQMALNLRMYSAALAWLAAAGEPVAQADPSARSQETPMPQSRKLTPVLPVQAIEPVLPFWQALGFEVTMQVPHGDAIGFAILGDGRTELMYQTHGSIDDDLPALSTAARQGATFLFVEVDDIDAVERAVAGAEVVFERRQTFYGATEIGVREPGGHYVTFAQFTERSD
jgi:dipeptidase D